MTPCTRLSAWCFPSLAPPGAWPEPVAERHVSHHGFRGGTGAGCMGEARTAEDPKARVTGVTSTANTHTRPSKSAGVPEPSLLRCGLSWRISGADESRSCQSQPEMQCPNRKSDELSCIDSHSKTGFRVEFATEHGSQLLWDGSCFKPTSLTSRYFLRPACLFIVRSHQPSHRAIDRSVSAAMINSGEWF